MKRIIYISLFIITVFIAACERDPSVTPKPLPKKFGFEAPANFPQPAYNFANNTVSLKGFELGRWLFYDPILSRDNMVSCASCHQDFAAFANLGHPVSHGIDGQMGTRNSPPIFNVAWHTSFMWDGGINHIESQPLAPITNPVEMDETLANVVLKLQNSAEYPARFREAFGDDSITTQRLSRALAQFMAMMVSASSKYDKYIRNEGVTLTMVETNGLATFTMKCAGCHPAPLFTDHSFRNNGLDTVFADSGRELITGNAADRGRFKVPSLRNVGLTGPYMHDGRFTTLEEVLDHYSSGVLSSPTLDPSLVQPNNTYGIPLTAQEKQDLISFLETLTDRDFVNDQRFKNPF